MTNKKRGEWTYNLVPSTAAHRSLVSTVQGNVHQLFQIDLGGVDDMSLGH